MRKIFIITLSIIFSLILYAQKEVKIIRDMKKTSTPQSHFRHADIALKDTVTLVTEEETPKKVEDDPDFSAVKGKGNSTFSDAPNTLARIFTKNATIESIVSTFPNYSANSADGYGTNRRTRIYNMSIGREARDITLEYDAETRKVETIILYTHSPDKYKQILLNAGYRWDSDASMTATAFGDGYRSYWKKKGSPICFVFNDRIIKVFRISR